MGTPSGPASSCWYAAATWAVRTDGGSAAESGSAGATLAQLEPMRPVRYEVGQGSLVRIGAGRVQPRRVRRTRSNIVVAPVCVARCRPGRPCAAVGRSVRRAGQRLRADKMDRPGNGNQDGAVDRS